jgi:hypothetical protein
MDEAGFLTDMLGKVGEEGDDVVLHLALDLVDARRIDLALATLPDRLGASFGTTPSSASASVACASISNQMRNRFSGAQMAVMAGRE